MALNTPSCYQFLLFVTAILTCAKFTIQLDLNSNPGENVQSTLETHSNVAVGKKLLIVVLDGFRWDYYDREKQRLPGFRKFVSEGVQTTYVEPIFPSLSYPSWTTLVTGLYPSQHNILGNYMLHLGDADLPETVFQLKGSSTKLEYWWKSTEPLWTTATQNGLQVFLDNFANCDVPVNGTVISPGDCTGYEYHDFRFRLRDQLNKALSRFRQGYSLAMIYDDSVDHAGHVFGPDSNELKLMMTHVDNVLQEFMNNMKLQGMQNQINVVITSDHGMTSIKKDSGVEFVRLDDYIDDLDDIYKVIDYGAVVSIVATKGKVNEVYEQLLEMPGVEVYKKENIPEEFHYKEGRLVHDLLLVAKPGCFIVGLKGEKQIPSDNKSSSENPYAASHGYYNSPDMRTIFFARGPAFKRGIVHPAIRLEDEYQIFTHVLGLPARPHNGTWSSVKEMLTEADSCE